MKSYADIEGFSLYYLEDSYVLAIAATPGHLAIDLEVVLTPQHPQYSAYHPGEQHCYQHGRLLFDGVTELQWTGQNRPPARDLSGESDYGNIDSWRLGDENRHILSGDFGTIKLTASSVKLLLDRDV